MSDYLWDRSGSDPEVERLEAMLEPFRHRPGRRFRWWWGVPLAAAAAVAVALLAPRPERPTWPVEWIEGSGAGRLAVGDWLSTGEGSRARLTIADIGHVQVEPESRVRLVGTGESEHRLELRQGRLEALVFAPPRLFVVDTPSATAVDLGCAYTLEVDGAGDGRLSVRSGHVELGAAGGLVSVVPGGASCVLQRGRGPGVPYFDDAPAEVREAEADVAAALRAARPRDTLTLWHLLPRVAAARRAEVFDRLAGLVAPPEGVTREAALGLDPGALSAWRGSFDW